VLDEPAASTGTGALDPALTAGRDHALDGLRGVAAMIVVLCHFVLAFQPGFLSGNAAHGGWVAALVAPTPLIVLWNPEFAVAVFFVLSGAVLSASAATTRMSFPALVLRRWIRLALPILGSSAVIWLAVEFGALHNAHAALDDPSGWLAGQFAWWPAVANDPWQMVRQSVFDVFATRTHWWNQALWTMQIEFVGSVGVFAGVLLLRRARAGDIGLLVAALVAAVLLRWTFYADFAAGVALYATAGLLSGRHRPRLAWIGGAFLAVGAVLAGGMPWAVAGGGPYWDLFVWLSGYITEPIPAVHALGAMLAVGCVMAWRPARRLFTTAAGRMLGRISFMVYLSHIALLCTLVSWVVVTMTPRAGYGAATAMALCVYLAALLPVAAFLTRFCDAPAIALSRAASLDRAVAAIRGAWRMRAQSSGSSAGNALPVARSLSSPDVP
jgi:peptidoglycan/LPS O-acetylase OafA/YrhL